MIMVNEFQHAKPETLLLQLRIDDCVVELVEGQTILEVAVATAIQLPTLCHHPDLTSTGSYRIWLVEVTLSLRCHAVLRNRECNNASFKNCATKFEEWASLIAAN